MDTGDEGGGIIDTGGDDTTDDSDEELTRRRRVLTIDEVKMNGTTVMITKASMVVTIRRVWYTMYTSHN